MIRRRPISAITEHIKNKRIPHGATINVFVLALLSSLVSPLTGYINVSAVDGDPDDLYGTVYEAVGHYAFAKAANNNVARGDDKEPYVPAGDSCASYTIEPKDNEPVPENWLEIYQRVQDEEGYTMMVDNPNPYDAEHPVLYNNLSGSRLDVEGGEVQYATIRSYSVTEGCGGGAEKVLVIRPDGEYGIFNFHDDITDFVKEDPTGWYFVSFIGHGDILNPNGCNKAGWSITAVYERDDLEVSQIKLIAKNDPLWSYGQEYIPFDAPYYSTRETEILGVYTGGGVNSWSIDHQTEDVTAVILEDGSYQPLGQYEYNGKVLFAERRTDDFAKQLIDIPEEDRSHNIRGGELDVFDETLGLELFGGRRISGLLVVNTSETNNPLIPVLFGFRQPIETPELSIVPSISANDPTHPTITIKNTSQFTACNVRMEMPLNSIGVPTKVTADTTGTVTTAITGDNLTMSASNVPSATDITLNLTVPEKNSESLSMNPILTYYMSLNGTCDESTSEETGIRITTSGDDIIYRVLTRYVNESGEELAESTFGYANAGDSYTTSPKEIKGYSLSATPQNSTGVVGNEPIVITYIYKLVDSDDEVIPVPNTGIFTNDKNGSNYAIILGVSTMSLLGIGMAAWFGHKKLINKKKTEISEDILL